MVCQYCSTLLENNRVEHVCPLDDDNGLEESVVVDSELLVINNNNNYKNRSCTALCELEQSYLPVLKPMLFFYLNKVLQIVCLSY